MSFFDKIIPFFVGHRTEILGAIYTIIRILSEAGVIPNHVADAAEQIIIPAAGVTFAAKISRLGQKPSV